MIRNYPDHAANERTFLAWVRTALAIAAIGVAISKLGLIAHGFSVPAGVALVSIASVILIASTYRFIRLSHTLDRPELHRAMGIRSEVVLAGLLVLFIVTFGFLLWLAVST